MASTSSSSSRRRTDQHKNLTCAVCQLVYTDPRLLPCFHTFCLSCLERLCAVRGGSFPCPSCRKRTPVPSDGATDFQTNFYISENDLEKARKGVDSSICPIHSLHEEPLAFFCVQCDKAVCMRCKLTKHENHETEDLTEAAERCKRRLSEAQSHLEKTVNCVQKSVSKAKSNVMASNRKRTAVKEHIEAQRDAIISSAKRLCATVLQDFDKMSDTIDERLYAEHATAQHGLDVLEHLLQRVQNATDDDATDMDVLDMEQEMREGNGNRKRLCEAKACEPDTNVRPGLKCDVSDVKLDDILITFIGRPITLTTPNVTQMERVSQEFRCGQEGECREVHALCAMDSGYVRVAYGGTAPDYTEEKRVDFHSSLKNGEIHGIPRNCRGRLTFKKFGENKCFTSPVANGVTNVQLNSKSTSKLQIQFSPEFGKGWLKNTEITSWSPFQTSKHVVCSLTCQMPYAFDTSGDEQLFVLVQLAQKIDVDVRGTNKEKVKVKQPEKEMSTTRTVNLFQRGQSQAVATYSPPQSESPFFPTDVCFWRAGEGQEEKLLIADYGNDCVHVVDVTRGLFHFERYLAAGCGYLVKPTAFDTDCRGCVWIGCGNGWVLKCQTLKCSERESGEDSDSDSDF